MLRSAYAWACDLGEVRMGRLWTTFRMMFENTWKDQVEIYELVVGPAGCPRSHDAVRSRRNPSIGA